MKIPLIINHVFNGIYKKIMLFPEVHDLSHICRQKVCVVVYNPDSKVHGATMGPTWVLSAPDGPHIGPMNLAIRGVSNSAQFVTMSMLLVVSCMSLYDINSATYSMLSYSIVKPLNWIVKFENAIVAFGISKSVPLCLNHIIK